LAFGFLMINWLTGVTSWLLCRYLTRSRRVQLFGVTIYLFNAYHFELLYARTANGDLLASTFLTLVLLGCLKIWNESQSDGWLWIALGMASIANSHLLSLLMITIFLAMAEIYRWCKRKINKSELVRFLKAGLVACSASLYSLGNIVYLSIHNRLTVPFKDLVAIDLTQVSQSILTNKFVEMAGSWNLGLPVSSCKAWHAKRMPVKARPGMAWQGNSRQGKASQGNACPCQAGQGKARHSKAKPGKARPQRPGKTRQVQARPGKSRQGKAKQGKAMHGKSRQRQASPGKDRQVQESHS